LELNSPANFSLWDGNKIRFIVVNGFLLDLISGKGEVKNGLIIK